MQTSKLFISFSRIKKVGLKLDKEFSLNTNDIIIYSIYLPNFIDLIPDLAEVLNSKEIERAERFHKELDKNRFIICRAIFKFVLAAYTQLEAKNICLDYHFNKKPYLASHPWLHFNLSHSEDYAVIAIAPNMVGIDIEYIAEDFDFIPLLQDIFDDTETLAIQNSVNKKHTFYTSWTRKEAFVKALGKGIDDDFKKIPCLDGLHSINSTELKTTENWQVYSFDLENHYVGAVAVESLSTIPKNIIVHTMPNTMKSIQAFYKI